MQHPSTFGNFPPNLQPRPPMHQARISSGPPNQPPVPNSPQIPQQQQLPPPQGRRIYPNDPRMMHQMMGRPAITKRKRRLGDRLLPRTIRQLIPESEAYMELLEVEKKLDQVILRKKLGLQEAMKKPFKTKRKLRIILSSTFTPGSDGHSAPAGTNAQLGDVTAPGWELRVEGKLLEESGQVVAPDPKYKRKFSSFFKSLVIELDKDLYGPDNHLVEWHRTVSTQETDGFQVKRPGDSDVKCTVLLMLDYQPPQFKLDPRLARILGLHTATRSQIFYALWNYIKTHRLQDANERDFINCDAYLEQVFNVKRIKFAEIPSRLMQMQLPPDPIVINHIISVEGDEHKKSRFYDIDVEVEDVYKSMVHGFLQSSQSNQELSSIDGKITEIVDQVNQMKVHRDFYIQFSDDPQQFITSWLASQCRDLRVMTDVTSGHNEEERQADYYTGSWTQEAIMRYFYNKVNQRRQELEHSLGLHSSS